MDEEEGRVNPMAILAIQYCFWQYRLKAKFRPVQEDPYKLADDYAAQIVSREVLAWELELASMETTEGGEPDYIYMYIYIL